MNDSPVHRSFWVVDALEENSVNALQHALINAVNTLCLCPEPLVDFRTGLCAISRSPSSKDAQLRVLQDISKVCLKSFHQAVGKLKPSPAHAEPDQYKLATVLKSIADLVSRPDRGPNNGGDFQRHRRSIHIVAQDVRFGKHLKRVLQTDPSVEFHFSVFPCNLAADPPPNEPSPESRLIEFASGIADLENVTFTICPCDPLGFERAALLWVRDLLANSHQEVNLVVPQLKAFFDKEEIMCLRVKHMISLDASFRATPTCPCHGEPLEAQPCALAEQSSTLSQAVGISDAWCSVTRAPLRRQDCRLDPRIVQIGSTILRLPTFAGSPDLFENTGGSETGGARHCATLCAIAKIPVDQVPEAHLTGEPHTLFSNVAAQDASNDCMLYSLCSLLNEQAQVLLMEGRHDLGSNIPKHTFFTVHYIARPAEDCRCLLLRKIAPREQLLPMELIGPNLSTPDPTIKQKLGQLLESLPLMNPFDQSCISNRCHAEILKIIQSSIPLHSRKALPLDEPQVPGYKSEGGKVGEAFAVETHSVVQRVSRITVDRMENACTRGKRGRGRKAGTTLPRGRKRAQRGGKLNK